MFGTMSTVFFELAAFSACAGFVYLICTAPALINGRHSQTDFPISLEVQATLHKEVRAENLSRE